jgi:dipeptidyl-peptidase 4
VNDFSFHHLNWFAFHQMIVASVDVRGTGFRGNTFEQQTYLKLGEDEAEDVISTVEYFKNSHYRVRKVCVWGWSYGGFLTGKTLQRDVNGVVDCGVSVAPVTDWHYYDTAYTERYMQRPSDNPSGYNLTSLLWDTTTFQKRSPNNNNGDIGISPIYLLIHGTADDNVHYQQSAVFSRQLVQNGVPFRFMAYTNDDHSISLPGSSRHLYALITNFFVEKFGADRYNL